MLRTRSALRLTMGYADMTNGKRQYFSRNPSQWTYIFFADFHFVFLKVWMVRNTATNQPLLPIDSVELQGGFHVASTIWCLSSMR